MRGRHSVKAGFDLQFVGDDRVNTLRQIYTFPRVDAYVAARDGDEPLRLHEPSSRTSATRPSATTRASTASSSRTTSASARASSSSSGALRPVQDPGRAAVRGQPALAELQDGQEQLRTPRRASPGAWTRARGRCVRASTGIMYEPPLLNLYEDAILRNGDPRSFTATLNPTSAGAPAFPEHARRPASGLRAADAEPEHGRRRLRQPVGAHDQRPDRARARPGTSRCRSATSTRPGAACRC